MTKLVDGQHDSGREKLAGEREKTPEEIRLLKLIHNLLDLEFKDLGIPTPFALPEESVHFVSPLPVGVAVSSMMKRSIEICPEESFNTFDFVKILIHEFIHTYSRSAIFYRDEFLGTGAALSPYRSGYLISNRGRNGVKDHDHFRAFNEGVVDKMAVDMLIKYAGEMLDIYEDSSEKRIKGTNLHEYEQTFLIHKIIDGVASETGKAYEEVWRTIKRGLFTGEMMPLRDIERVYGKGSLKVLDCSIEYPQTIEDKEQNKRVLMYFTSKSVDGREQLKREIFKASSPDVLDESLEDSLIAVEQQAKVKHEVPEDHSGSVAETIKGGDPAELQKLADRFDVA
jgi:hypothetical protein